jgi:hypothetical protein
VDDEAKRIYTRVADVIVKMTAAANKLTLAVDELTSAVTTLTGSVAHRERQDNEAGK